MFKALTTVEISLGVFNIEADTVVEVRSVADMDMLIGEYNGYTFEITPDEYVKLTHTSTNTVH